MLLVVFLVVGVDGAVADPPSDSELSVFTRIDPPVGVVNAEGSSLVSDGESVYMVWVESEPLRALVGVGESAHDNPRFKKKGQKRGGTVVHQILFAKWNSVSGWSEARTVEQSTQVVANWADFPSLAILKGGTILVSFPERSGGSVPYAYDVVIKASYDDGESWVRIGRPHGDLTATEHGFCSIVPAEREGGAFLFWLDGRAMAPVGEGGHGDDGEMSLRSAWFHDGRIDHEKVLDRRTCECCTTDGVMAKDGSLVVYRNRDGDEVRDISIVRFAGGKWSEPVVVHHDGWVIPGCPVNGPAVDASGNTVVVAWYTIVDGENVINISFSRDGGRHFDEPITVDRGVGKLAPLGRVDVILDPDSDTGDAIVSWLDTDDGVGGAGVDDYDGGGAVIRVCRVRGSDGLVGEAKVVSVTSPARSSGFPMMVGVNGSLVMSWTEVGKELTTIRAAVVGDIDMIK